jgi:hypothetical protein
MALVQQPNYDYTGYRTFLDHDAAQLAKILRLKHLQQQCASIERVIFLPSVFPRCRSLIHLPDISQRTFIGPHVFSLTKGCVILEPPTGPVVLAIRKEGVQTWCLEYDAESYGGQLGSLQTDHGTIQTSYDTTSTEDMASFRTMKDYYQRQNSGMFDKFPQEVSFRNTSPTVYDAYYNLPRDLSAPSRARRLCSLTCYILILYVDAHG